MSNQSKTDMELQKKISTAPDPLVEKGFVDEILDEIREESLFEEKIAKEKAVQDIKSSEDIRDNEEDSPFIEETLPHPEKAKPSIPTSSKIPERHPYNRKEDKEKAEEKNPPQEKRLSREEMIQYLKHQGKKEGVQPIPEFIDVLTKEMHVKGKNPTKSEIDFFLIGVMSERRYTITTAMAEMVKSLGASLEGIAKLEKVMEEKIIRDNSIVITSIKKIEKMLSEPTTPTPRAPPKENPQDDWKIAPSVSKDKDPVLQPPYGPEEMDKVNTDKLPYPRGSPQEIYEMLANKLGINSSKYPPEEFKARIKSLPTKWKMLLASDLLDDNSLNKMREEFHKATITVPRRRPTNL